MVVAMGYQESPLRTPKLLLTTLLQSLLQSGFWLPEERFIRAARCAPTEGSSATPLLSPRFTLPALSTPPFYSNKAEDNPNLGGNKSERGTSPGGEGSGAKP